MHAIGPGLRLFFGRRSRGLTARVARATFMPRPRFGVGGLMKPLQNAGAQWDGSSEKKNQAPSGQGEVC